MATYSGTYAKADTIGRPAFEALDTVTTAALLAGATPPLSEPIPFKLGNNQNLAQFTVVGLNAGLLVTASDTVKPIGVLAHAAVSDATNTKNVHGQVFFTGCFNIGADSPLVWGAAFDTDTKKIEAFNGSPTPTQIVARKRLA